MPSHAAVGESKSRDSEEAGRAAMRSALDALGGAADAVVVFATAGHDQGTLLAAIRREAPDAAISGCTGAGVITRTGSDEGTHAVAVLALRSDRLRFTALSASDLSADPEAAGGRLGARVREADAPRLLLLFPDGLTGNSTALLRGLTASGAPPVPVFGGAAGELMRFERTFQYVGGEVASDTVAALLVEGDARFDIAVSHGCQTIGIEHEVTRSAGGTVYELDGRPAWEVLREYIDAPRDTFSSADVPYLALAQRLRLPGGEPAEVIRVPLGLDPATGALFFPGELPEGETLAMARREAADVVSRAVESTRELVGRSGGARPVFVLQADCTGRGRLLFGDSVTAQVIAPVQEAFGHDVPWLGFHSYGEIAPLGDAACYHNYTMALCAAYDEPSD